jgi:adenylosuccinate lyase
VINRKKISLNLDIYAPFAATESILMATVKKGADRQEMHEVLRLISMKAWGEIQMGKQNPMSTLLVANKIITRYLNKKEIQELLDVSHHIGNAPERARQLVKLIKSHI